jgi:hypothetical protein
MKTNENRVQVVVSKKSARRLKLIGGTVLLMSFISQNFFYDVWASRVSLLAQGMMDRAIVDKSVLLNEILYFTARSGPSDPDIDSLRETYIREAARKLAISVNIPIESNESLQTHEKVAFANRLLSQANSVANFPQFLKSVTTANESYDKYPLEMNAEAARLDSRRKSARFVYLGLYLVGSLLLLVGIYRE